MYIRYHTITTNTFISISIGLNQLKITKWAFKLRKTTFHSIKKMKRGLFLNVFHEAPKTKVLGETLSKLGELLLDYFVQQTRRITLKKTLRLLASVVLINTERHSGRHAPQPTNKYLQYISRWHETSPQNLCRMETATKHRTSL